jgi:hypothetical protein
MAGLHKKPGSKHWFLVYRKKVDGKTKQVWRSSGCTDYQEALDFKEEAEAILHSKPEHKRKKLILDELSGKSEKSLSREKISNLWKLYKDQPQPRRVRERTEQSKESHIERWISWMEDNHPEIKYLDQVAGKLALEYFIKSLSECFRTNPQ